MQTKCRMMMTCLKHKKETCSKVSTANWICGNIQKESFNFLEKLKNSVYLQFKFCWELNRFARKNFCACCLTYCVFFPKLSKFWHIKLNSWPSKRCLKKLFLKMYSRHWSLCCLKMRTKQRKSWSNSRMFRKLYRCLFTLNIPISNFSASIFKYAINSIGR